MKPKDFEQAVLDLAMTTRVPLTRANILFYSGVGSKQAERWIDQMLRDGLMEFDSDDEGNILYSVHGIKRPSHGGTELTRCTACGRASVAGSRCSRCGQSLDARLRGLRNDVDRAGTALALLKGSPSGLVGPAKEGDKSVLAAGLLGLFGPLGWLYAAPLREALPAVITFLLMLKILPAFLVSWFIMPLLVPASVLVSALYAWKHNRAGHRSGLVTDDE